MEVQPNDPVPPRGDVLFELRHITKQFPGVRALDDVSLAFRDREVHGLVGENGAGKSTLMNIMMGLYPPDEGALLKEGRPISFACPSDALRAGLGMVPQELNLVPQMTVMENILLESAPRRMGGIAVDWAAARVKTRAVLERIDASVAIDAVVADLSAAQQQLVQIARALAQGAHILIFDEPTSSLSLREADRLLALIRQLRESGCSIVYISHRLVEVLDICDRVTVLRNGCKVAELDAQGATEPDLVRHMIGREGGLEQDREERPGIGDAASNPLLVVDRLSHANHFEAISFTVRPGEIVGLAGLVGAGRTELARCLFGDMRPTSGRILLDGKEIRLRHPGEAIAAGIAYVPEERKRLGIFPVLGVAENMTLPVMKRLARGGCISRRRRHAEADAYIRKLDIRTSDANKPIRDLSGGNQQKVILARWLLTGCRMLILDEPTRGIDVNAKFEIHGLLRQLAAGGMAILLISSELEEVILLADRIVVMHEGAMKGEMLGRDATQEKLLTMAVG